MSGGERTRPRRWWLAALLNLLTPPVGYAYVGAWRLAIAVLLIVAGGSTALMAWTFARPPGIYGWDLPAIKVGALVFLVALSAHAAWLSQRAKPASGARWKHAALYLAIIFAALTVSQGLRAVWPQPSYSVTSASMEPSLSAGDILGVQGARISCGRGQPRPGDVVIYHQRAAPGVSYAQRVVAGPGQTVALEAGRLVINGVAVRTEPSDVVKIPISNSAEDQSVVIIHEVLANGVRYATLDYGADGELDNMPSRKLGPNEWFILGDSRDNALDSRVVGPISSQDICGVAVKILQSKDKSRVGAKP